MTYEEFEDKFRGRMLVFHAEAWALRKQAPSDLGMMIDGHHRELKLLLREMYNALNPPITPPKVPK